VQRATRVVEEDAKPGTEKLGRCEHSDWKKGERMAQGRRYRTPKSKIFRKGEKGRKENKISTTMESEEKHSENACLNIL